MPITPPGSQAEDARSGAGGDRSTDPGRDECEMSGQMFTLVAAADVRHGVSMRREFGIHLENIAPECDFVKLIARDDLMFDVEVIKDFYKPFLSVDGWVEFVDATDIQEGDFVVFVYHGNFCFKAHIFNPTGHEKSFSHCEPPTEISGAVPSGSICDHRVMNGHEALEANDQPSMNLEDGSAPLSNHVKGPSQHSYVLAQGATLPTQMKKSVEEKVQEIGSEIPIYVRKMTESNIFGSGDESTGSQVVYPMAAHHAAQSGFAGGGGEGRSRRLLTDPGRGECELLGQKFTLVAAADVRYGVSMRREFGRHLENIAPEFDLVKLITRDGLVFDFEVIKDFYEPFLSADEWDEFVDATNIQEGDSVMFVYCGNFCFKAHILNSSDHENSFFCCQRPIEMFGAGPSSTLCDHRVMNAHKAQEANDQASMNLEDGSPPLSDHVGGPLQHSHVLSQGATLPTQMKKSVEEKVQEIGSEIPIYVRKMTESNIFGSGDESTGSQVVYPMAAHPAAQSGFAGGGGEGRSRRLLTDPGRGECELLGQKFTLVAAADVRYGVSMRREFGRHLENIAPEFDLVKLITRDGLVFDFEVIKDFYEPFLSADEWDEFVDATNIQEGDSVMFVYCGNFCFKAHIFNSSDHENSFFCCQRPIEMFGAGPSSTLCDHRVMNAHKAQEANDQASMNLEDGSPPLSDHVGGPSQHSYILAERATLPTQMKKRVVEKVQAIQSNFPIYVKVMTETSITGSKGKGKGSRIYPLTFCRKFASPWLPFWNTEIVLQVEGKTETWRTMFEVRHDKTRWIHKWWDKFVRGNGLKVGMCVSLK